MTAPLAVRDVSISVQPGEIVALLGANGAGKSTTVRMIAGVLKPQKGAIRFGGEALTGTPSHHVVRRGITLVPEGRLVFPQMTVMENLQLGAHIKQRGEVARAGRAGLRPVPAARRAAQPARRLDERRRAADAGDCARPDGRAHADHPRRAVARPDADRVQEVFRLIEAVEQARHQRAAGRAEPAPVAAHRPSRLRAGKGRGRAGRAPARSCWPTTTCGGRSSGIELEPPPALRAAFPRRRGRA